jgi:hypothetical protein
MRYAHGSTSFLFYRVLFEYFLARESKELNEESHSGLSSTYYFTSYYLNGMLSAAEGTGSDVLLRRVLGIMDTMLSTAQKYESRGRVYYAWRPFSIASDTTVPRPNLHFTFQATVPIARAAAIIMTHPRWKEKYEKTAQRYIAFVDQSIIQYWYHDQLQDQIPWINPDQFPLWNDNGSNLALIATFLYEANGDQTYKDIAYRIGRAFKSKLSASDRGWIWENQTIPIGTDTDNTPGSVGNQAGVPDTSHANREAFLMVSLYESGILFTRGDLERMGHTLTDKIWNQSITEPGFANYLNGSNKPYRVYKEPGLNGSIYHGWVLLGGYSEKAQQIMMHTVNAIVKGKNNLSLKRNATSYGGKLSLCGHILRNFAVPAPIIVPKGRLSAQRSLSRTRQNIQYNMELLK